MAFLVQVGLTDRHHESCLNLFLAFYSPLVVDFGDFLALTVIAVPIMAFLVHVDLAEANQQHESCLSARLVKGGVDKDWWTW